MSSPPPPATNTTTPPPAVSPPPPVASAPPPSTPTSPPPPDLSPPPPASGSPPPPPSSTPTSPPPPSSTPLSPPPPSSLSNSPPPTTPSSSSTPSPPSSSSSSSSSSSLTSSAIIGIAIGGVVILLVFALLCICCTKKRRRRRNDHGNEHYYIPPPPPKDGYYGGAAQHWQQSNPSPAEQYAMPKPSPPAARPPPSPNRPPTPTFMNSSGGSGSNYSGSGGPLPPPSLGMEFGFSKNAFTYEELERATEGFSDDNLLGQGGFGYVYKGVLPNGKEVAVKSLKAGSVQGDREFQAEVEIISRVHHKHLVSLVGYCIAGAQRMLVYEFVPNKTLEFHLHGKGHSTMNWQTRLKIALGSAKGLAYLHEDCHPKIIHRDIKAANILLDFKFEAKVADFGLAKFSSDLNTHISTRVMGTFGYLAPEYASSGKLTDKSDVFSFGVMLLELITGHRPFDTTNTYTDDCFVDWARPLLTRALEDNNFESVVDQELQTSYNQNEMARMVACAAACVRHSARRRPRMSQVVRALEGDVSLSDLNDGVRPGHSTVYGSSDYDTSQYKEAFRSQEHGSSEYTGTTSEYGVNASGSSSEAQTTREMEMGRVKTDSQGFSATSSTEHTIGEAEPEKATKGS